MGILLSKRRLAGFSANQASAEFSADWCSPDNLEDRGVRQWRIPPARSELQICNTVGNRAIAAVTPGDFP